MKSGSLNFPKSIRKSQTNDWWAGKNINLKLLELKKLLKLRLSLKLLTLKKLLKLGLCNYSAKVHF